MDADEITRLVLFVPSSEASFSTGPALTASEQEDGETGSDHVVG